jgi:putative endonuclease
MNRYYYVYVLQSQKDKNFYTGFAKDIRKRVKEHQSDATAREKYLKSSWGKSYIKNRLKKFISRGEQTNDR